MFAACKMDNNYITVTFDSNYKNADGEIMVYHYPHNKGSSIHEKPEMPIRPDYIFDGWYTDNDTFTNEWDFSNTVSEDITLYAKWRSVIKTQEFTSSTNWVVPADVKYVDVFCVGGGGSGAGDFAWVNQSGSGGNGGVVTFKPNVSVTPGKTIQITVGAGGVGGTRFQGKNGGTSSFGNSVVSDGGYGGVDGQPEKQVNYGDKVDSEGKPDEEEKSGRGGHRGPTNGSSTELQGGDGIECPFYSTGKKYGAGGAGANSAYKQTSLKQEGGNTGGGNSGYGEDNTPENRGSNATFYGGGGGGGAFSSNHTYSLGGNGSAGIVIIRY